MQNSIDLFGFKLYSKSLDDFIFNSSLVINTINPHSYCVSKRDLLFRKALQESDILLPDGIGIVYAVKKLHKKNIQKIAGDDLHTFILKKANVENLKVFYLGSSENTLQHIKERLRIEYPAIKADFFSPPYKQIFTENENKVMIEKVNSFSPDILFIGMTAPKQEKWVYEHKSNISTNIICSIGAVFDFYAGTVKRPPQWLIKLGLEWLGRLLKEPKRMFKRNFISTPEFLIDVLKEVLNKRI